MQLPHRSCGRLQRPPDRRVASGCKTRTAQAELLPQHNRSAATLGRRAVPPNPPAQPQDLLAAFVGPLLNGGCSAPPKPPVGCAEYGVASVAVLLCLRAFEQQRVGRLVGNGAVLDPTRHDEEIT